MQDLKIPKKYTVKNTPKETLEKWYRLMTIGRAIDEKAPNYLKQAIGWSYHAPYAGHDGIQLAIGQHFEKITNSQKPIRHRNHGEFAISVRNLLWFFRQHP